MKIKTGFEKQGQRLIILYLYGPKRRNQQVYCQPA